MSDPRRPEEYGGYQPDQQSYPAIKKVRKGAHGSLPAPTRLDDCRRP